MLAIICKIHIILHFLLLEEEENRVKKKFINHILTNLEFQKPYEALILFT